MLVLLVHGLTLLGNIPASKTLSTAVWW